MDDMAKWDPRELHRADCATCSYNAGDCDCDGPEVQAEVERLRAEVARLKALCGEHYDRAEALRTTLRDFRDDLDDAVERFSDEA